MEDVPASPPPCEEPPGTLLQRKGWPARQRSGASAEDKSELQDVGIEYEVPSARSSPGMDGDSGLGDLASNKVGGGTANKDIGGRGLVSGSRGAKILQSNQGPFLLVGGTCYVWASRSSLCAAFIFNLEDRN